MRKKVLARFVTTLGVAGLLAACSTSGGSTSGGHTSDGSTQSQAGGGGSTPASTDAAVTAAKAEIAKAAQTSVFTPPGPAFDASSLRGKTIHVVSIDLTVPVLADANTDINQIAQKLGIQVTVSNAQDQVSLMQKGIQDGIDQHAGAIIILGVPIDLVRTKLVAATAAGIPVVNVFNSVVVPGAEGQGAGAGVYATVGDDLVLGGRLPADKAIVDTDGKANVLLINSAGLTPAPSVVSGIKAALQSCSGCTVEEKNVPLASWGTDITPLVASSIRSNPKLNYVIPIFDGMGIFAAAGVQQAGASKSVKVASFNGTSAALALVKKGDVFTADPGASTGWTAYAAVDQAMRGMLKLKPAVSIVPILYLDTAALANTDTSSDSAVYGNVYVAGYQKLWGGQ